MRTTGVQHAVGLRGRFFRDVSPHSEGGLSVGQVRLVCFFPHGIAVCVLCTKSPTMEGLVLIVSENDA